MKKCQFFGWLGCVRVGLVDRLQCHASVRASKSSKGRDRSLSCTHCLQALLTS
jgi:hypothetical protein